jgi:beta-galactosidase
LKYLFILFLFLSTNKVEAQSLVLPMNENWEFTKDIYSIENNGVRAATWQHVALPHTWNVAEVMDDVPGYFRGTGTYKKRFFAKKEWANKEVYLLIEGANQSTAVYLNGKITGTHTGGYTAFYVPLTQHLIPGKQNELIIQVDNSHNPAIPPLTADFTFYGGLYRQVSMIIADPVHFSFNEMGSNAVYISTPDVSAEQASLKIKAVISGKSISNKVILISRLYDAKDKLIVEIALPVFPGIKKDSTFERIVQIAQPRLWSPSNPYLYRVVTTISDAATGKVLDEIKNPVGFRWFRFDGSQGFFLNGKPMKLMGASRHQDYEGMGNAVSKKLGRRDVELIKEMGGNFLRVAHYPQDAAIMQACDELGILASVEIPVVNEITESDSFYNNSMRMQQEMIRQNFNHPSVIIWCYMNEVLLRPQFNEDKQRQAQYFNNITKLAKRLDSLTRAEDPTRYTMMANHGAYNRYRENGLLDIPMIVGWNLYAGWYGADMKGFPAFLDQFHKDYPSTPMLVTEYGADADPRIRSINPVRFDKSIEYSTRFHQYYFHEMIKRPFVGGGMVWNLADFNSETRNETMPHINNKGLLEWNRKPKDPYYFYKAALSEKPFIKILGAGMSISIADSGNFAHRRLQVANNFDAVALFVNGKQLESRFTDQSIAEWDVALKNGINIIEAKASKNGKRYSDKLSVNLSLQPALLTDTVNRFKKLHVLLGAGRYFTDDKNEIWIPAQQYKKGGWGYIGGKPFKLSSGNLPYGTDKNIRGTFNDPIYQTQQTGLSAFRLDVPAGEYEITMHFAELVGGNVQQLVYNLDSSGRTEQKVNRIFDVVVNGKTVFKDLNIEQQYGIAVALNKTIRRNVKDNEGINITFSAVEGEPVLNALQVKKLSNKYTTTKK